MEDKLKEEIKKFVEIWDKKMRIQKDFDECCWRINYHLMTGKQTVKKANK